MRFVEMFRFAKNIFIVNVSNQVLEASHLIIVTRAMGLQAAAVWSVSTKLFTLIYQIIIKIEGTAVVFFAEMMARNETDKLAERYRQVYKLTAGVAIVLASGAAALNTSFVSIWTEPSLAWPLHVSLLFAFFVFSSAVIRCNSDLIIFSKRILTFKYVYLAEAITFVALALWLAALGGFVGILMAGLICLFAFRGIYTSWRVARYFGVSIRTFCWTWLRRPILAGLILLPFVFGSAALSNTIANPWFQFSITLVVVGLPCIVVLLTVALPRELAHEAFGRLRLRPLAHNP